MNRVRVIVVSVIAFAFGAGVTSAVLAGPSWPRGRLQLATAVTVGTLVLAMVASMLSPGQARRYEAWRKMQGPGYPDFPAHASVTLQNPPLPAPGEVERIRDTWIAYHRACAKWEAWAAKQNAWWKWEDFLRRPF